ncbi:MAG: hypothetical protein AVDCRST_MAG56-3038 [uncultured Cytophagales bacterium]|uniref:Uncharacterized protein n=1 Tax=uncultured Cytophagales bacterium TaxID=158755 RepID=A0A6J4J3G7_9SPHI|nr:MAG: hypothetical protein AVDCRST_MAG56-3038 [uncultured Cytophagales bacterium]
MFIKLILLTKVRDATFKNFPAGPFPIIGLFLPAPLTPTSLNRSEL